MAFKYYNDADTMLVNCFSTDINKLENMHQMSGILQKRVYSNIPDAS